MTFLAVHVRPEIAAAAALCLLVAVAGFGSFRWQQQRLRARPVPLSHPAARAAAIRSARKRVPALVRDGEPLTAFEERQLGRIEMEALVTVAEPFYAALEDGYERLADAYRRLGPPGSAAR